MSEQKTVKIFTMEEQKVPGGRESGGCSPDRTPGCCG